MRCFHCRVTVHDDFYSIPIGVDKDGGWVIARMACPSCKRFVMILRNGTAQNSSNGSFIGVHPGYPMKSFVAYPKSSGREPCPPEVPSEFADDYKEACLVVADSPKASAALTRRCLQNLLRDYFKVKHGNLADEIQQILDSGKLPTGLAEEIDAVRNIGNFAAHPLKNQQSGQVMPVEPGEAEWNLEVIESLFDFCFVQPAARAKRKAAFNQKLQEAGKRPMK